MTELTIETLREILREELARELAPIRAHVDGLPIINRALTVLQQDMRELRGDVDKLIVIVRSMRSEVDVTGGILVRVERRLERLEEERLP